MLTIRTDKPTTHICIGIFCYFLAISVFLIWKGQDKGWDYESGALVVFFILFIAIIGTIIILMFPLLKIYSAVGLLVAIAMVVYGLKYKQSWLGQVSVVLGFIVWTITGCWAFGGWS